MPAGELICNFWNNFLKGIILWLKAFYLWWLIDCSLAFAFFSSFQSSNFSVMDEGFIGFIYKLGGTMLEKFCVPACVFLNFLSWRLCVFWKISVHRVLKFLWDFLLNQCANTWNAELGWSSCYEMVHSHFAWGFLWCLKNFIRLNINTHFFWHMEFVLSLYYCVHLVHYIQHLWRVIFLDFDATLEFRAV